MENMANQTMKAVQSSIESLQKGETLLAFAIKTSNPNKVQLELAEKTQSVEGNSGALLGLLNKSDERFSGGARRAWITAEISDLAEMMNINCGDDADWEDHPTREGKEVLPLNIKNPTLNGLRLRVRIVETTEPTEYQAENVETAAKRRGADGDYITHNGEYIFSNTEVVPLAEGSEPEHFMLKADPVGMSAGEELG